MEGTGGGGGGGTLVVDFGVLWAWLKPLDSDKGFGCGIVVPTRSVLRVDGFVCTGREASLDGPPPGPPGRSSLPFVIGLPAICLPRGVGREMEFGGSPDPV